MNHTTFHIKVTALSPLHIGTGEELTAIGEYLTTKEKIYFLKHKQLMQTLKDNGHFNSYIEKILEAGNQFDFHQVLAEDYQIKYTEPELGLIEKTINVVEKNLSVTSNNNLSLCTKTARQAYIPGSSIKGMLRTAILYHILNEHQQVRAKAEDEIKNVLLHSTGDLLKKLKSKWTDLENGKAGYPAILPEKIFRSIRPYDSNGLEDDQLAIYQVYRQHLNDPNIGGVDWLVEAIQQQVSLDFELTLHPIQIEQYLNFPFIQKPNIKEIFNLMNECSKTIIDFELNLINQTKAPEAVKLAVRQQLENYKSQIEQADGKYALARMGKGKSLFYQTILPILRKDIREDIIKLLKKEKAHFPQSIVLTSKDYQMMGWIKLTLSSEEKLEFEQTSSKHQSGKKSEQESNQQEKQKIIPASERKLYDNQITQALVKGLKLKIYFYEFGMIELSINGKVHDKAQLNKSKTIFPKQGQRVEVIIKQYSEAKGTMQLALI